MKILLLHSDNHGNLEVNHMADSTTLRSGQPFFVPDFAAHYAIEPMIALRVGRLGKCIAPRFAHRYIDAATATCVVCPLDDNKQPTTLGGAASLLDGSVFMGKWIALDPGAPIPTASWSVAGNQHTIAGNQLIPTVQQAIAHLSQYCTLKMGDIVCLAPQDNTLLDITIGDRVTAQVGDTAVLKNNIK